MYWEALLALALPAYGMVHEQLANVPAGWTESSHELPDSTKMQLQVAVQMQNLDQLESKLAALSTPSSPDYGKYLEKDELDALFAPSDDAVNAVKSWVSKSGAQDVSYDTGLVKFTTTVGEANKMLDTKFALYTDGKSTKLRTLKYSIPDELSDSVDLVSPTTYFGGIQAHRAVPKPESDLVERQLKSSCEKAVKFQNETFELIGPDCLKELYNVGDYTPDPSSGSSIAFGSFLNQSANYKDAAQFEKIYDLPAHEFTVLALINGGVNNQSASVADVGEANLDSQNILGLVGDLPVGEYITGGSPPFIPDLLSPNASENQNEPYLQYYTYLLSQSNADLPYVITNSYGDHEDTVPEKYAKRVCNLIGMMGCRGRTILESSGDEGTGAVCKSNRKGHAVQFTPIFPATCPYLTGVGGLQFFNPEQAWNASSGGFSNYFPTAWYQKEAVETYLSDYINPVAKEYYTENAYANFSGRGFPDVSAHSLYPFYLTVLRGTPEPNGGTSAAAPVVAAIVALLNDALLRAGKPALGFLNPWLYSVAAPKDALNDITTGGAVGCSGVDLQNGIKNPRFGHIKYASWNATVGWDPVTGLGSPNFQALMELALGSS